MENKMIDKKELMELYGLCRSRIQALMVMGLPFIRTRSKVYYNRNEAMAWFKANGYMTREELNDLAK